MTEGDSCARRWPWPQPCRWPCRCPCHAAPSPGCCTRPATIVPCDMWAPEGGQGHIMAPWGSQGGGTRVTLHPQHHCPPWGSQRGDSVTLHPLTPLLTVGATGWTRSHHTPNATAGVPEGDTVTLHPQTPLFTMGGHSHTTLPIPCLLWGVPGVTRSHCPPRCHHGGPQGADGAITLPQPPPCPPTA